MAADLNSPEHQERLARETEARTAVSFPARERDDGAGDHPATRAEGVARAAGGAVIEATVDISPYLVAFDAAIDKAILEGFVIVRGNPRLLLLDLDTAEDYATFHRYRETVKELVGDFQSVEEWQSKSGNGRHVAITLDRDLSAAERILLQIFMGSDRIHELLSLTTGIWAGNAEPSVLFKPGVKAIANV